VVISGRYFMLGCRIAINLWHSAYMFGAAAAFSDYQLKRL
jgi:hypothetical protein